MRLDAGVKFMGLKMRRTEKHVLTPPGSVDVEGEMAGGTNTTVWKFEVVPEGTLMTARLEIRFKRLLKLLGPIASWQGKAGLREWMRAFARYVETK